MAHCTKADSVVVLLVDGISDISLVNINVYPNPTQGVLMIENKNTSEKLTQIEIMDIDGNVVNALRLRVAISLHVDLSEEAKGIYFLDIRSQSGKEHASESGTVLKSNFHISIVKRNLIAPFYCRRKFRG